MGCLNSTNAEKSTESANRRVQIKSNEGRKQQGVHELKQNYHIDAKTKVLGVGTFGRVFQTYNKFNTDHLVAIKVLDK